MSDIIDKKIKELIEIAQEKNEKSTEIVLWTLKGCRKSGQDKKLALMVADYVKDVLKPEVEKMINQRKASRN